MKAFGVAVTAIAALTAIGALLRLLGLFLQGLEKAGSGTVPADVITAMVLVAVVASAPWWLPLD